MPIMDAASNQKLYVAHWAKFVFNPSLINGILNVLPYELVSWKGYEKPKKWSMYSSNCKIFCDLFKGIPKFASDH